MWHRVGASLAVAAVVLTAASGAWAQAVRADWVPGDGYWDDPASWSWPGGAPLTGEQWPDDTFGTWFDCRLESVGSRAALAGDVSVFDVRLNQDLRLVGGSILTVTAVPGDPAIPSTWGPEPLVVLSDGLLDGTGTVEALAARNQGAIVTEQLGHDLMLAIGQLQNDGIVYAKDGGRLTIDGATLTNSAMGGGIVAVDGGLLTVRSSTVANAASDFLAFQGGTLVLEDTVVTCNAVEAFGGTATAHLLLVRSDVESVRADADATVTVRDGSSALTNVGLPGLDLASSADLLIESSGSLHVYGHLLAGADTLASVVGGLEIGLAGSPGRVTGPLPVILEGGTVRGTFEMRGSTSGAATTGLYGYGTVDVDDLALVQDSALPVILSDMPGGTLTLSGYVHGKGTIGAVDGANLVFDGAFVEVTGGEVLVPSGALAEAYDSTILAATRVPGGTFWVNNTTFYDTLTGMGPTVEVAETDQAGHLGIETGDCRIRDLRILGGASVSVSPGAQLQVDYLTLAGTALLYVEGTVRTEPGAPDVSWGGGGGSVFLDGGRVEGTFANYLPLYGWGEIATADTLDQRNLIAVQDGVLELVPGTMVVHEWPELTVAAGAELFVNNAEYYNEFGSIFVDHGGVLRLHEADLVGNGAVKLALSGPPVGTAGADLIATGYNYLEVGLDVGPDSEAQIASGQTFVDRLRNEGYVLVSPGAELLLPTTGDGTDLFENHGAIQVAGHLDVDMQEGYVGANETGARIDVLPTGRFDLWGDLAGAGDIAVAGIFHAHDASYLGAMMPGTVWLEGGTLEGSLLTDHAIVGYGTITGYHAVDGMPVRNPVAGTTLLITDATLELVGASPMGGLEVSDGARMRVQDASVIGLGDPMTPEFWVRGYEGGAAGPETVLTVRDATMALAGHVERGGRLDAFGVDSFFDVSVHTDGRMNVYGDVVADRLAIGVPHPETIEQGGGHVYVAPGAILTTRRVQTDDGPGGPGVLRVAGRLRFAADPSDPDPPTMTGSGAVWLDGGCLEGEGDVRQESGAWTHGYGRIAAALRNEGQVSADVSDAWLRLDTNDKTNAPTGLVAAVGGGRLAVEEIRLQNEGSVAIDPSSHLLVDAAVIENVGGGVTNVEGSLELRRGGSILGGGPLTAGPASAIVVGALGQVVPGDPAVAYNEFALPATTLAGSLTVLNPVATGQAAPDTGNTILTVGGDLGTSGAVSLQQGGTLAVQGSYQQTAGGTVVDGLLRVLGGVANFDGGSLAITTGVGGTLDLSDNNLIVNYDGGSPFAEIQAWVRSGLNLAGDLWQGPGITSSAAAADPNRLTALGVIDNSDPEGGIGGLADLEGVPVDLTSVLVKHTWWGDANIDGVVDINDYDKVDFYYKFQDDPVLGLLPEEYRWGVGDFTYDGRIDINDYDRIDFSYKFQAGPLGVAAPVPEPATVALVALGGLVVWVRRRRG